MKRLIISIICISCLFLLTGTILPALISTNQLPLFVIVFALAGIVFITGSCFLIGQNTMKKYLPNESGLHHILLDMEDFECLVRGGILTVKNKAKIMLKDIGFSQMQVAIIKATQAENVRKDHVKKTP